MVMNDSQYFDKLNKTISMTKSPTPKGKQNLGSREEPPNFASQFD